MQAGQIENHDRTTSLSGAEDACHLDRNFMCKVIEILVGGSKPISISTEIS